jgi:hypothetical protein
MMKFAKKLRAKVSAFEREAIVDILEAYVAPALPFRGMEGKEFEYLRVDVGGGEVVRIEIWASFLKKKSC